MLKTIGYTLLYVVWIGLSALMGGTVDILLHGDNLDWITIAVVWFLFAISPLILLKDDIKAKLNKNH